MKKTVVTMIILLLITGVSNTVLGAIFENIKMGIDLPEDKYFDLKAGVESDDAKIPYYELILQTTKDKLKRDYNSNGIIYNGISDNLSKELIISSMRNLKTQRDHNLNDLKEEDINLIKNEISTLAENNGLEVVSHKEYNNGQIKFIYSIFESDKLLVEQYYTVVNGNAITIALNTSISNDGMTQDNNNEINELKKIVDTIEFTEIEERKFYIDEVTVIIATIIILTIVVIAILVSFLLKRKNEE